MRPLLVALALLLATVTPVAAIPITQLTIEFILLGQVHVENSPDLFNLFQEIRREEVFDITDNVATLISSRVITPDEYLHLGAFATTPPLEATPEPATLLLLGTSLGVAGWVARKRRGR